MTPKEKTAIEWFFEQIMYADVDIKVWREIFNQAIEMEKQQQGYSEEEVIAFGEFIFKHSLLTHTRGVKSLFEQFKKKKDYEKTRFFGRYI